MRQSEMIRMIDEAVEFMGEDSLFVEKCERLQAQVTSKVPAREWDWPTFADCVKIAVDMDLDE